MLTNLDVKKVLEENFAFLNGMEAPEYSLYRKWVELNALTLTPKEKQRIWEIKNSIWTPGNLDTLDPVVIFADTKEKLQTWTFLRYFVSRMTWKANPGRSLKFYCMDRKTRTYMGLFSLGSDFISVGGRDRYIGWSQDNKLKDKMLNHTAMGNTIVPTQPLGYNYLGGKLMSLLVASDTVENVWNSKYAEPLVGITTTSLYGGYSQYNSLNYWKKCDSTTGEIPLEPSNDAYDVAREWLKSEEPEKIRELQSASHPKGRTLQYIYKTLGVRPPVNNHPRGVYWCGLYKNANEFLRKEQPLGEKKFDNSVGALVDLWKTKYARKRIEKLGAEGKIDNSILFYDDVIGMSWEECKDKYLLDR